MVQCEVSTIEWLNEHCFYEGGENSYLFNIAYKIFQ